MAEFAEAYDDMIRNEGGYTLHKVSGDRGGQTYGGIARRYHPEWSGWQYIDADDLLNPELPLCVRDFYKTGFWDKLLGDRIESQRIADTLFDFAVNAGYRTAVRLAQQISGATPDGIMGPTTLAKLNAYPQDEFMYRFALAKLARYAEIVNRDRSQSKFLLGWVNRTLKGIA